MVARLVRYGPVRQKTNFSTCAWRGALGNFAQSSETVERRARRNFRENDEFQHDLFNCCLLVHEVKSSQVKFRETVERRARRNFRENDEFQHDLFNCCLLVHEVKSSQVKFSVAHMHTTVLLS